MSQRDLVAELHGARIPAPPTSANRCARSSPVLPPPARRWQWRRVLVVAVPAVAAVAAAVSDHAPELEETATPPPVELQASTVQHGAIAKSFGAPAGQHATHSLPPPAPGRVSRYGAFLSLRVDTAKGVSNGVKRALQVATSLGGFSTSVHASTQARARPPI